MKKRILIAVSILILGTFGAQEAFAITPVTSCGTLSTPGETYVLSNDIPSSGSFNVCFTITADNITLDGNGFFIEGLSSSHRAGVMYLYRTGITVKNLGIQGFSFGIHSLWSDHSSFIGNEIRARNGAIGLTESHENIVSNNLIKGGSIGIGMNGNGNIITGNTFSDSLWGLSSTGVKDSIITGNTFLNNRIGIELSGTTTLNNDITGNRIEKNDVGIKICKSHIRGNTLFPNEFRGPQRAIEIKPICN